MRTWTGDIAGILHSDYVWHDMAQAWQTPEIGEQVVAGFTGSSLDERIALFVGLGLPNDIAAQLAAALDDEMGRCILRLYRTGAQPAVGELGDRLAGMELPPGLIVDAELDEYIPSDLSNAVAVRLGTECSASTVAATGGWSATSTLSPTPSSPSGRRTDDYITGLTRDVHRHSTGRPRLRAITRRWISLVPSPTSRILASR